MTSDTFSRSYQQLQLLKEWDAIFPIVPDIDKEAPNAHEHAEELWEQLDHLGLVISSNTIDTPDLLSRVLFACL